MGTALLTDRYELTMLDAALASGLAQRPVVFQVFARRLPAGRRYGVLSGLHRFLAHLPDFRFDADELSWLVSERVVRPETARHLEAWRFGGDITAYAEGEVWVPRSPLVQVRSTFGDGVLLETLLLSCLNGDSAVAAAAARIRTAAGDARLIEMGSRRAHEQAAVANARTAWMCGFDTTSNLAAGRLHGVPTSGTVAHAFVLAHPTEKEALAAYVAAAGPATVLLVDTYDVLDGVRTAVEVAGPGLAAVRLDSGNLPALVPQVRRLLDELGAAATQIVCTGDLDEASIPEVRAAGANAFGVGSKLAAGGGAPSASLVYKVVEQDGVGVAKRSEGKTDVPGARTACRRLDDAGRAVAELVLPAGAPPPQGPHRVLQSTVVRSGEVVADLDLAAARAKHAAAKAELPDLSLAPGEPIPTIFEPGGPA
ncbi:MAG TPA: nicotinate phosphoribosyltransferase [Mycobacteriales bacterium]|nr:nicotinate phosphoribosyltransferase [Mycobacteriales bacterium]